MIALPGRVSRSIWPVHMPGVARVRRARRRPPGSHSEISLQIRSGRIGTASELRIRSDSSRYSRTSSAHPLQPLAGRCAGSPARESCCRVTLASPSSAASGDSCGRAPRGRCRAGSPPRRAGHLPVVGDLAAGVAADEEDQVGLGDDAVGAPARIRAGHARRQRVIVGQRGLGVQRRRHRDLQQSRPASPSSASAPEPVTPPPATITGRSRPASARARRAPRRARAPGGTPGTALKRSSTERRRGRPRAPGPGRGCRDISRCTGPAPAGRYAKRLAQQVGQPLDASTWKLDLVTGSTCGKSSISW